MKINKIKINSFGKVKNKEINLENNINIIYGKNETGKSTLQKFIITSLYGISRNKNGKEISDYEKYKPWDSEEFSGKLEYELDNKETYEVFRDFNKKNPQIFNSNKEDISKQFNINKNKGNEFFYEQTNVEENLFSSTLFVGQQEAKLEKNNQNNLIQKIANLVGTGEDNVSYKLAMDRINRRQLEEIGTDRSREKPINIINKKISDLEKEKEELEKIKETNSNIDEDKKNKLEKISDLEDEKELLKELLKELKRINENVKNENEKIKINENIKNENIKKIELIKNENKKIKEENNLKNNLEKEKIKNKNIIKLIILFLIIILFNLIQYNFIKNKIINYILFLTVPMFLIFYLINLKNKIKKEKNIKNKLEEINKKMKSNEDEINLLEKNNLFLENEIKNIKEKNNLKNNLEKEKIKNKYSNKFNEIKLNNLLIEKNIENNLEKIQEELNTEKIKFESLKIEEKNAEQKLEKLLNINEQLVNEQQQYVNLKNFEKSFELTKEVLEESYEKMRNSVTPKFTANLSKRISDITDGKYKNITVNDNDGIMVELENGNYMPVSRLSVGTIDQIYLSLRLSMIEELSEEKLPIILDETFAYWDDERLKNILEFLIKESEKRQIIIFTCSTREISIIKNLNKKYNYIEL